MLYTCVELTCGSHKDVIWTFMYPFKMSVEKKRGVRVTKKRAQDCRLMSCSQEILPCCTQPSLTVIADARDAAQIWIWRRSDDTEKWELQVWNLNSKLALHCLGKENEPGEFQIEATGISTKKIKKSSRN